MHPQAIGRPSRLTLLREMIAYTRKFPGVWHTTCAEAAEAWEAQLGDATGAPDYTPFIQL
jgi:hypothetical protein